MSRSHCCWFLLLVPLSGCTTRTTSQEITAPQHTSVSSSSVSYDLPYPKKKDIPKQEKPGYHYTPADTAFLRWMIAFDASLQQLKRDSDTQDGLTAEAAARLAQRWQRAQKQFRAKQEPTASSGIWMAYDLYLSASYGDLNRRAQNRIHSRAAEKPDTTRSPFGPDYQHLLTDEERRRRLQHDKDAVNYCLDLTDLAFPGKLPPDILSFRMK